MKYHNGAAQNTVSAAIVGIVVSIISCTLRINGCKRQSRCDRWWDMISNLNTYGRAYFKLSRGKTNANTESERFVETSITQ
jgi:hypothetical protein